ncbi:hypothetical protein F4806DRAFT_492986 [Annulohypoxylon nitens]|nr:hypothetical protein F4806DRAFT_492986 [Annulohypoxylon nitens]
MTTHVSPSHLSGVTDILTPNALCCPLPHNTTLHYTTIYTLLHLVTPLPQCHSHISFRNLSRRVRIGVGLGLLTWGAVGLHLSDRAEERYGFTPTEEDKAALDKVLPRIITVDRNDFNVHDASPISNSNSSSKPGSNSNST